MSEKGPKIRAIGNAPEETKEKFKKEIVEKFLKHRESFSKDDLSMFEKYELEKTPEQIKVIERANEESNLIMKNLGLEPFNVSPDNIHIVDDNFAKDFGFEGDTVAKTVWHKQGIILFKQDLQDNPLYLAGVVFHEILHLKEHLTLDINKNGESTTITRGRWGLLVSSSNKKNNEDKISHTHFQGLTEAVVASQEWRTLQKFMKDPLFAEEVEWMNSDEARKIKREYASQQGFSEQEVFLYAKNITRKIEDQFFGVESKEVEPTTGSYPQHVRLLQYAISEIYKEFSERYSNPEQVFDEFIKANFTGQLLTIARLVEGTFGEGGLRSLGEMTEEPRSAVLKMETLKKLRSMATKKKERI